MEYYTGVLQHPETHVQYYPVTLWELIIGRPTNFSDVYDSTINLYSGTVADHTNIGSFTVNSQSNVDIYFPVASTTAMGLVPILDGDTTHFLRGDGTWATPAGGGGGGGGEENVQSDWDVTDTTSDAYIKHKPDVDKVTQETLSSGSRPILLAEKSTPDSNAPNKAKYSSKITASPSSIVVEKADGLARTEWTGDRPFKMQTRLNTSASWSNVENRIIASDGLLPSPTVGKFLKYEGTGFAWDDPPIGNDTTYQLTLNGTTNGDSTGGVDLGTLYAPTGAGTQYNLLQSAGSGAPTWFTPSGTGLLKFTANTGWGIDTNKYSTTDENVKQSAHSSDDNAYPLLTRKSTGSNNNNTAEGSKYDSRIFISPNVHRITSDEFMTRNSSNYTQMLLGKFLSSADVTTSSTSYSNFKFISGLGTLYKSQTSSSNSTGTPAYIAATELTETLGSGNYPSAYSGDNHKRYPVQIDLTTKNAFVDVPWESSSTSVSFAYQETSSDSIHDVMVLPTNSGDTLVFRGGTNVTIGSSQSGSNHIITINASGGSGGDTVTGKTVTLGTTGQAVIQVNGSDAGSVSLPAASSSTAGITLVGSTSGGASAYNHTHGSITNAGAITSDTTIGSQDHLVITDHSDSNKIKRTSITFGSSTTTFLSNDGQWRTPAGGSSNPRHLDVWIGHRTSAQSIVSMDAPFFCTDTASPDYDDGSRFFAFPGLSCQWGVYGNAVSIPEHITLWPNGTHAMNNTSTGCDNWMAVMMTSWGAGHPMSLSYVRSGVRKWMPLVYVGPLNVGTAQAPVIRSVAIDLGAAIMIHLINNGLVSASTFPFATVKDKPYLWSLTQNFTSNFSIGTSPITFRYFSGTHTNNCSNISSMEPSGGSNQLVSWINTGIVNILKHSFEFPLSMIGSTLEDEWSKVPGWEDDPRYDSDPGIKDYGIGSGVIFRTWKEIVSDKDYNYEGVLVCTALPEIHAIQHI